MGRIGLIIAGMLVGASLFARNGIDSTGTNSVLSGPLDLGTNPVTFNGVTKTNWPIDEGAGTTNASGINVVHNPVKYAAVTPDVEAHIAGIDGALSTFSVTTTNILITGILNPDVTGTYTNGSVINAHTAWYNSNGFVVAWSVDNSKYYILTNLNIAISWTNTVTPTPEGIYLPYNASEGTATVSYSYNTIHTPLGTAATNQSDTFYSAANGAFVSNLAAAALSTNGGTMGGSINFFGNDANNIGNAQVVSLQVTGGSPTNGAVWVVTNENGTGTLKIFPKIFASRTVAVNWPLAGAKVSFPTLHYQVSGNWDGTNWTPSVVGWMQITVGWKWGAADYNNLSRLSLYKNGVLWGWGVQHSIKQTSGSFAGNWSLYNDNAANTYSVFLDAYVANTNSTDANTCYISGAILP